MKITLCYITARRQPMFKWFVDSLISQYPNNKIEDQIVIIDLFIDYDENRKDNLKKLIDNRFEYLHIPPKPSIWLGKHRKTSRNFYDGAGTRNTGFIVCDTEYIVFIDDLSVLMPNWLSYHRKAAEKKIIFSGAYDKVYDICFKDNIFQSYTRKDLDCRLAYQKDDNDLISWGGWAFGTNTGFPMEYIMKVNGYDEFLSARRGGEDCNLGIRLENAGYKDKFFYNKNCLIIEDTELHYNGENTIDDFYTIRRWKSDIHKNHEKHNFFANIYNEMEQTHLYKDKQYLPLKNHFDLYNEKILYKKLNQFKSVDQINFIDFDGELLHDI